MPNVSVIIPLYNKAPYIRRTLHSVLTQTWSDFEVIVVDDGSSDAGPDIVKGYRDERIRLIRQPNAGPGAARNHGTGLSTAPLVTYLDADDEWMPSFLRKSVRTLDDHPECDFVTSGYFIGPDRADRGRQLTDRNIPVGAWRLPLDCTDEQLGYALAVFHACSTVYRRPVVEKYGGFYSKHSCNYGEDVYLWLQILFNHRFYRREEPLAWYHCEASQLGLSSDRGSFPVEPSLTDVEPLYESCPPPYRPVLRRWLGIHALRAIHLNIELSDTAKAKEILKAHPVIRKWKWEYLKLRTKMLLPGLIPSLRRIRAVRNRLTNSQSIIYKDRDHGQERRTVARP